MELAKRGPAEGFRFDQAAADLKVGCREGVRWVPQVVISENPMVSVEVELVLEARLLDLEKVRRRCWIQVQFRGNTKVASVTQA